MEGQLESRVRQSVLILTAKYKYKLYSLLFARFVSRICSVFVSIFRMTHGCIFTAYREHIKCLFWEKFNKILLLLKLLLIYKDDNFFCYKNGEELQLQSKNLTQ